MRTTGNINLAVRAIQLVLVMAVWLALPLPSFAEQKAKNIIFMVPDGMGLADVTAARIFKNGLEGDSLYLETLKRIGYQRTYSKNCTITDSAPAASAWSCGEKFNNGEICFHNETGTFRPSVLEIAKSKGKSTGLVATSQITHATPAAFGSHVVNRNCQNEIGRQYIQTTKPDVLLGGGFQKFDTDITSDPDAKGCPQYDKDLVYEAQTAGYTFVANKAEMDQALLAHQPKLLGLFHDVGMTPTYQRTSSTHEPTLAEMTQAALSVLGKDKEGFFVMIEGSQIDWGNHAVNFEYQLGEVLAFDDAVKVVLDWLDEKPYRKKETLVIIAPDHETGGFAINGPQSALSTKGNLATIEPGWTFTVDANHEAKHTGGDVMLWSQGPGSRHLARPVDNTDLYKVMVEALTKGFKNDEDN